MNDLLPTVRDELARLAEVKARRRRRRRRMPAATITTAAVAVAVALTIDWPSHRLDAVAQARAALTTPADEVIHSIVNRTIQANGSPTSDTVEEWSASDPTRWRIVIDTVQTAYQNGTQTTVKDGGQPTQLAATEPADHGPGLGPFGDDPVTEIRALLADGELRDAGDATVDGQTVRRLQGQTHTKLGDTTTTLDVTYDVDPDSYEPIAVQAKQPDAPVTVTLRFERFERLPATPENTKLLDIQESAQP